MSTTIVETWSGADLSQLGPIYPMVGTEFVLFLLGIAFWIGFHVLQAGIEKKEMQADEEAARSPERLRRVFEEEAGDCSRTSQGNIDGRRPSGRRSLFRSRACTRLSLRCGVGPRDAAWWIVRAYALDEAAYGHSVTRKQQWYANELPRPAERHSRPAGIKHILVGFRLVVAD